MLAETEEMTCLLTTWDFGQQPIDVPSVTQNFYSYLLTIHLVALVKVSDNSGVRIAVCVIFVKRQMGLLPGFSAKK